MRKVAIYSKQCTTTEYYASVTYDVTLRYACSIGRMDLFFLLCHFAATFDAHDKNEHTCGMKASIEQKQRPGPRVVLYIYLQNVSVVYMALQLGIHCHSAYIVAEMRKRRRKIHSYTNCTQFKRLAKVPCPHCTILRYLQ